MNVEVVDGVVSGIACLGGLAMVSANFGVVNP